MNNIKNYRSHSKSSYVAYVSNLARNSNNLPTQLTLEILGNRVNAVTKISVDESVCTGIEIAVNGHWSGPHWNSQLMIESISSYEKDRSLSFKNRDKQTLLNHLLEQLRPSLKHFVISVLNSDDGRIFMRIPASREHHHNHQRGLLSHSLESAVMAGQLAMIWLTRPEAELTIVATLFHDFGKSRTTAKASGGLGEGIFISHEACTLELLAPYLKTLEAQWPIGANILRHLLSDDSRKERFPAFPGKLLLKLADQLSTSLNRRTTLFSKHPPQHYFTYDKQHNQKYLRVPT